MKVPAKAPAGPGPDRGDRRARLLGFGEHSVSKSYYPELKRRLEELERFRSLLDQTGEAIFLVDGRTGRITDAAGAAGTMLRQDRQALVGRLFEELLPQEAVDHLRGLFSGDFAAGRIETVLGRPGVSGGVSPSVEVTFRLASGEEGPIAIIVARDVTERKKNEQALKRAEEKYRGIVENAAEGIFQSSLDGRLISANPAMASLLGYASTHDLMRHIKNVVDQIVTHPEDRQRIRSELTRYDQVKNLEVQMTTKTGNTIWGLINARRIRDAAGEPERFDGSLQDVTVRKKAEQTLLRYHDELETRVAERTAELTRINERLTHEVTIRKRAEEAAEAANRAKSDFLSMVSHEIRTPLTSVLGFAVIIEKRLEQLFLPLLDGDPRRRRQAEQIMENLGIIVSEGERLKHLINDVLDLAKLEAGKMAFKQERVDPAEVVRHVMSASVGLLSSHKKVSLDTRIEGRLPEVLGDRDRLIQVLVNLVSNALKFTERGSVTCRARLEGHYIVVDVADTGIGIPEGEQHKVFEKFNQIGATLTNKPKGTGLGLAICKHIVESHGGRIFYVSKPGAGSTFTFTLPIA
uniref:histidine kinase n=1 Tax=Desulfovibrio sp. U5L TaxID=596152 RepID=I2Q125_9BACT